MRILITGTSSGIGHALTLRLLDHGHTVVGLARSDQSALMRQFPGRFIASRCDVSTWSDVTAARDALAPEGTQLDALVMCAGVQGAIGRAVTLDPLAWSATVRQNLDGTYFPIRAFWSNLFPAERRAKVICFSGGGATKPRSQFSAYGAAKTAIVRLVETLADEEQSSPVDINAVAPGAILTSMTEEVLRLGPDVVGTAEYDAAKRTHASTTDTRDEALNLVEWLLSPQSDGISGRLISATWDPWRDLGHRKAELHPTDIFTLRRILPQDRGATWP